MREGKQYGLKGLAEHLRKDTSSKVIFMVGAGISTSCGIPDFRSPKKGLYHNLSKFSLPYAEAVFDIDYFQSNPKPFYTLASELYPDNFRPSKFHYLMKLFHSKERLKRIYTQNIDTLERVAGIDDEYLIEAHGSFASNHCITCQREYPMTVFKEKVLKGKGYAECTHCKGLIKPKIVFFGEDLPSEFYTTWEMDQEELKNGEDYIVIVAGTSLVVYPFASLPAEVPHHVVRALINNEVVGDFKDPRKRDFIIKGTSDDVAQELARELGWLDELNKLCAKDNKTGKENIDEQGTIKLHTASIIEESSTTISKVVGDEAPGEEEEISELSSAIKAIQLNVGYSRKLED